MSVKQKITTDKAPVMMPDVLSQAIVANNTVYCSGAIGVDPATGKLIPGSVGDRTHRTIQNLSAILQAADSSLEAVFKVNVFLSDMSLFADMNKAYKQYWGDMKPSRTCVAVKQLPLGTDVEIECQAVVVGKAAKSSKL